MAKIPQKTSNKSCLFVAYFRIVLNASIQAQQNYIKLQHNYTYEIIQNIEGMKIIRTFIIGPYTKISML